MSAEESHEIGRQGVIRASLLLWRLLGDNIIVPFNAYDHHAKLTFEEGSFGTGSFSFDLRGVLSRKNHARLSQTESTEVFVEVKNVKHGNNLKQDFENFLRRSAIVSSLNDHKDTWFFFIASVPFGTSLGVELCDGSLLEKCSNTWPKELKDTAIGLHNRISLIIATTSFTRMLEMWGRDA